MNKLLTLLLLLLSTFNSYSQEELPTKDGIITYSQVIKLDSTFTKDILYANAKRWFVATYKSANDVIQLDDKESGEITGKGVFAIDYFTRKPFISHTVTILVKNGRYKYTITNFSYSDNQNEKFSLENFPRFWGGKNRLYTNTNDEVIRIIKSLENTMSTSNKKEDW
jgi:hypothetical protein